MASPFRCPRSPRCPLLIFAPDPLLLSPLLILGARARQQGGPQRPRARGSARGARRLRPCAARPIRVRGAAGDAGGSQAPHRSLRLVVSPSIQGPRAGRRDDGMTARAESAAPSLAYRSRPPARPPALAPSPPSRPLCLPPPLPPSYLPSLSRTRGCRSAGPRGRALREGLPVPSGPFARRSRMPKPRPPPGSRSARLLWQSPPPAKQAQNCKHFYGFLESSWQGPPPSARALRGSWGLYW